MVGLKKNVRRRQLKHLVSKVVIESEATHVWMKRSGI
jgi:hypothetical protein